mgnify:FL=1|tara:strand:+ start:3426 stop:4571 length:1146 start_codon:yes stop_codon:yes gene_type:complete
MLNIGIVRSITYCITLVSTLIVLIFIPEPVSAQSSWTERISFGGDFRQRHEGFFQADTRARQRLRFRFRLSANAEINDDVSFGVRLGSGDLGNPISTNQSFTDILTRKPISLDRAFFTWNPSGAKALTIGAGKFGLPVTRTQMTFDSDLNWEGLYQQIRTSSGPVSLRLVTAQVPLKESKKSPDAFLFAGYGEVGVKVGAHNLQFSIANYAFRDVDGVALTQISKDIGRNTNALSKNTAGATTGFSSDFNLVDLIANGTFDTGRSDYPIELTANFVKNTKAETSEDFGYWLTAAYGSASKPGTFQLSYTYAHIEREAVLSVFTFSDTPGTNIQMHQPVISYMIAPRVHLDFTGIFTKKLAVSASASNKLLKRTQLDARVSF